MKKIFSLLLALVCAVGTMYAGYGWIPDKKYCKWGDNFKFDHAFVFHNAGAHNNTYGDGNVDFQKVQGVIAFSYMAWAEFSLPSGDNYLAERVEVYLTANGQNDMPLVNLYMKDARGLRYKQWENTFNYECHFDRVEGKHDCTAYFVQKRQVEGGDYQYAYFNIVYSDEVYNYIHNNKNKGLGLHLLVSWDGNEYNNWYTFEQGELNDIMEPVTDPVIENFQWTKNTAGKTALRFTADGLNEGVYHERAAGSAVGRAIDGMIPDTETKISSAYYLNRERDDVASLTWEQLNLMGQDVPPYAIEVSRQPVSSIKSSYYDSNHGGPKSPFAGPMSNWKKITVPPLYLPEGIRLSHRGGDTLYAEFTIPKKSYGMTEDESDIIIEYATDPSFSSYETVRVPFNLSNRHAPTSYSVELPLPQRMLNQGGQNFHVRFSRDLVDHANTCCKASIFINTNLRKLSGVNAHDEGDKIKVSWTHEGNDEGIWTGDMYYRVQYIVDGTTYTQDFADRNLTSVFVTQGIPTCLPIEYTVQIRTDAKIISSCKSNLETMAPTREAVITSLTATKGDSNNRVRLQWTVPKDKNGFSYFTITRALRGDSVATTLVPQMPMNPALTTFTYEDNSMELGTYYNYTVTGFRDCDGSLSPMSTLTETGYALPYGVITGQITYDGRQGVPGVLVTAVTEDEVPVPKRLKMDTLYKDTIRNFRTLEPTARNDIQGPAFTSDYGTVMFWIRNLNNDRNWSSPFCLTNKFPITLQSDGSLQVRGVESGILTLGEWYHLAVSYSTDSLKVYVNGKLVGSRKNSYYTEFDFRIGDSWSKGYEMADVRIYNYSMDSTEIRNSALTIPLKGNERGLELYYSACEQGTEVHDLSGHGRHLQISGMSFGNYTSKDSIPDKVELRMVDDSTRMNYTTYTKSDGTYVITGVPYSEKGTYYKVIPTLGTHEFAPANRPLFFNNNANTHNNVNFTDQTSVRCSGAIYYEGTDYPVEGALLSIDGLPCIVGDVPVLTNADGRFSILVPMGQHYITATKNGHTFAYNGRYPEDPNNAGVTHEFLHDINDLRFYDNTKLLLVGRVAGGDEEMHKPHGMQRGKATIGRAVITLEASTLYSLNTDSVERVWEQPTDSIVAAGKAVTSAFGTDLSHNVVIYTDSVTGEYTALLPPLTYKVKSIVIPSNDEYRFNPLSYNPIELGACAGQPMMQDSLCLDSTTVRRVNYHLAFDAPYYVEPVLTVTDASRTDLAFGEEWIPWQDEKERQLMVPVFTVDSATGRPDYRMTYPMFRQGSSYRWRLKITETYVNKDHAAHPVTTVLPWQNGIVTVKSELGNRIAAERDTIMPAGDDSTTMVNFKRGETIILGENQIALDSTGSGYYFFRASDPNITKPYTLGVQMSYTNVYGTRNYSWTENGRFYGVVLGSITNGSDVLTSGPDDVIFILRNAPGGGSTVSATKGTTITKNYNNSSSVHGGVGLDLKFGLGYTGKLSFNPTLDNITAGWLSLAFMGEKVHIAPSGSYTHSKSWTNTSTTANTLTQTVSTTPGLTGSAGDVYVGQATNEVFSNSRRVDIQRDPTDSTKYFINDFDGFVFGRRFGTQFVYTQTHIETKLLPDYIRMRNDLLKQADSVSVVLYRTGQDTTVFVNSTSEPLYYTWLSPEDPRYGVDTTTYAMVPSKPAPGVKLHVEKDMVQYYNEQVRLWKQLLAHNEKMKVMCKQRSGAFKQEQYDKAIEKSSRVREVMSAISDARAKMAAVSQYDLNGLKAFYDSTKYGDGKLYKGFSKGEVERLLKTYNDNKKIEEDQLSTLKKEELDSMRLNVSDYYGGGYLMRNISLSPGASVALGETKSLSKGDSYTVSNEGSARISVGLGYRWERVGLAAVLSANAGGSSSSAEGNNENSSFSTNITLAMNATSSMSFDMYAAPDGFAPIFFVRAGATSCPYIGEERTKYYEPGLHVLTSKTMENEVPKLYLRQGSSSMQHDLPVGASAYFTLGMTNQSSVSNSAGVYKLRPIDKHSGEQLGAVLEVNGTPLTSEGITYSLPAGDSTFVSLRVYQSNPEVMRYDSIGLELISDCDPTRRSELWLTVSYRYSCSDINLTLDNTLLNTQTKSILGKDTVELSGEISGLLPDYSALYGIRLQYKRGEGEWSTLRTWRKGITVRDKEGNYPMPHAEHFRFNIPMPDKDYTDGTYQVRAVTVCRPAAEEEVCHKSETFTVIKDVVRPEPIITPAPADGILRKGDDISVTFTKDIQPARVLATNISVTGELNGHDLRHSVGLQLGGQKAATQATLRLGASDFTIETWLNYSEPGELMNIGGDKFRLSLTEGGKLAVQIDTTIITTTGSLPKNKWVFLALSYSHATTGNQLNASIAYDEVTDSLMTDITVPNINTKAALQLGGGSAVAMMHDLTIWSVARRMITSLSERSRTKVPSTPGLMAYWPMADGYGPVAAEHVHARHLVTGTNAWWIAGENYSAVLDGSNALRVPVSEVGIAAVDDYVLDFWVNANSDGTILRNGDTTLVFAVKDAQLTVAINGVTRKTIPFALGTWHYIALNVRRSGSTSVILDERVVYQYVDGNTTPRLGDFVTIGEGLTGAFDELCIARASVTNELLLLSAHFRLHGNETGLVAYYPFEKDSIDSGNQHQTVPTLEDRCTNALNKHSAQWVNDKINDQMVNGQMVNTNHPALVEARPVEPVPFTYSASDRQITIKLNDQQISPARVEGCNLRVEIKNVVDEHGNYSAPICWNLYVKRNSLLWKDSYAYMSKKELDEQSFELTMVNNGSEIQTWQINNAPAWLQLNATSGLIAPQTELTLTATLPSSLAAGYYADILLLTGNSGIAEPFLIEATVLAPEPEWQVNQEAYEATGNIIARLSLPAGVAQSEYDIIAAFTDGECVGIAHPQYLSSYDAWYVMMTVYGNNDLKDNPDSKMQFCLWNAESGITYSSVKVLPSAFRFTPNMVKGTLADPVVLEVTNRLQQTLALQEDWNWISLNIKPVSSQTEKVFEPVLGDITTIKSKTQLFTVNTPDTTYGGTLKTMGVTSSYCVKALWNTSLTIEVTAVNCSQTPLSIRKGWNWIGYLPLQTMSVNSALADIEPVADDLLKSKTAFAVYDGSEWVGTLTRMTAGEGYMYLSHAAEAFTFRYPESNGLTAQRTNSVSGPTANRTAIQLPTSNSASGLFEPVTDPYSGNMSVVARVMKGTEPLHDVEVGVFAGEECRGAATEEFINNGSTNGYWFLTIAGDEPLPLTIKVYDPNTQQMYIVSQTLTYTDDAIIGTLATPYIIQLDDTDGINQVASDKESGNTVYKVFENGIIYILRNGQKYDTTGRRVLNK